MLPTFATGLIGREREIHDVVRLLERGRIVTIVGAGGIGKTRLAIEIASTYAGDVCFVDLEPLAEGALVATTVAAGLGAELGSASDAIAAIVNLVRTRALLLVLDNCERVLADVRVLVEAIVERAPAVRVLATSREPLRMTGEQTYRLDALSDEAAVQLFTERVERAGGAAYVGDDAHIVAQICRKLDGIPLAIELAAARAPSRSPTALLARLNDRFQWRSGGDRIARRHHETMRSLIDWSFDLLDARQRKLFLRLGIFSGEFSLDAARYVAGEDADVRELVEKSLIVESQARPERFRMLESLRDYAVMRLHDTPEEERAQRAHATYFAGLAAQAAHDFGTCSEDEWRARFEPDLDNFRSALGWAQVHEKALAASMLGALKEFWYHVNIITEGLSRSQVMLASLPLDDDRALGPLLAVASLAWRGGEFRTSLDAATRALGIATRIGDARSIASARYGIGWALFKGGDAERAARELGSAVAEFRRLGDSLRTLLAEIDYAIALKRTDPQRGRELLEAILPVAKISGWPRSVMRIETGLAEYAFQSGDTGRAIELARAVLDTARAGRSVYALAVALVNLASYLSFEGDVAAREIALEAASLARANGIRIAAEWAMQCLALALVRDGHPRDAAQVLGHIDGFVAEVRAEREPTESAVRERLAELLSERLNEAESAAEFERGRNLTYEEAYAVAAGGRA